MEFGSKSIVDPNLGAMFLVESIQQNQPTFNLIQGAMGIMQTQQAPSQQAPNRIARNTAEIARQNSRVFRMIDQMVYHVDQIVEQAQQDNWEAVERMSKVIAEQSQRSGYSKLCEAATLLRRAASSPVDKRSGRRLLIKLLGAVGRA